MADPKTPRAVIHKRILEVAETNPEATCEKLSAEVSGASVDLVEQVLEEYGDPADDGSVKAEGDTTVPDADGGEPEVGKAQTNGDIEMEADRTASPLTEKQAETFEVIADNPQATQAEIGDILGVSPATVCNRVNDLNDFEWTKRADYVKDLVENNLIENGGGTPRAEQPSCHESSELAQEVERLSVKLEQLEKDLNEFRSNVACPVSDTELTNKVIRACIQSEQITSEEEMRVFDALGGKGI